MVEKGKEIEEILKREIKKELSKQGLDPEIDYEETVRQLLILLNKPKFTKGIEEKILKIMDKNIYIDSMDGFDKELMGVDSAVKEISQMWGS